MKNRLIFYRILFLLSLLIFLTAFMGCLPIEQQNNNSALNVVATTTIVADVVRQVGGPLIEVETLLPVGADPHSFEPAPQDMALIANASIVFASGAGLEEFLNPLLENAGAQARVIEVSQGITLLGSSEEGFTGNDPHVWMDPNNVIIWVENIRAALSQANPQNSNTYQNNAEIYIGELKKLDAWVRDQIASIPEDNRKIVTDHLVFGYFARQYGMEQVGAIVSGYSTLSAPSAQELAAIETAIQQLNVKAVFVGESVNPNMAQRVAEDTNIKLVYVYTGSLSDPGGPAGTYLDFLRYDVNEITSALK